jgi:hypothetical protein
MSIVRSVRDFNNVHLMDRVIYKGKLCFVNNGVSKPIWDLCEKALKADGTRTCYHVHENEFQKTLTWWNIENGLLSLHHWYMMYWFEIHLRDKLKGPEPGGEESK